MPDILWLFMCVALFLIGIAIGIGSEHSSVKKEMCVIEYKCEDSNSMFLMKNIDGSSSWYKTEHKCNKVKKDEV